MTARCPGPDMSDADRAVIARFAAFLRAVHGVTDEREKARIYLEHYPEYGE